MRSKREFIDKYGGFDEWDAARPQGGGGGGGRGGGRPSAYDQESRTDPEDGVMRTKREFIDKYGGFDQWDAARPQRAPRGGSGWDEERAVDPADGAEKTKRQFYDQYQSFNEW